MNISKNSVARKIMMMALTVAGATSLAFATNNTHIHAHAAARTQVSVQYTNHEQKNNVQTKNDNQNNNQAQNPQKPQKTNKFNHIYKVAHSKLGDRYSWGATGPHHFDCSGFTSYVYRKGLHKTLPRTAQAQYNDAKHVSYGRRKAGDLVFFGGSRSSISHVGLYIGKGKMIDAQNRGVVIENVKAPWWHLVGMARPFNLR